MFSWKMQRSTADPRMAREAAWLVEVCTASTVQAEAPWRHSTSSTGPVSWDAQLEGCGAVRRHVASKSTYCP
jgi:hypothetical protein